jgi:6-phosphogluconolactonase
MKRVVVYPDATTVATATAARLLQELTDALAHKERVDVVLTGGTVGIATLRAVAANPVAAAVDWTAVHLWWGDERFVPTGHADRNELQAHDALIAHVPIPQQNVHRMGASDEFDTPEQAAAAYASEFAAAGNPAFDVLMLGMGPDGHVASLFPGHPVFAAAREGASGSDSALAVHDSPKPPPTRVTLSLETINAAQRVWVVAAGEEKADAVARSLRGEGDLPAAAVSGTEQTLWLLDVAAASRA